MRFNENILVNYLSMAPAALVFERYLEAQIYQTVEFKSPILDIGCGDGLFSKILFADKVDTGIDPDPKELKRAKELNAYKELIECYGDKIPKPDNSYQTIFSNSVLEHITELKPVLREVHRLLRPGCSLFVTLPSNYFEQYTFINLVLCFFSLKSWAEGYRKRFNRFWKHYHCYHINDWKILFEENGFIIKQAYTYGSRNICLLNNVLTPFAIFPYIVKKLLNRWVIFPKIRKLFIWPLALLGKIVLDGNYCDSEGGLVFMEVIKK